MNQKSTLFIGFGRRDITPQGSVPMQGYGNSHLRMSQGVLTPLFATCIAITDEREKTLLLFTVDVCDTRNELMDQLRERIAAATGVDASHVMISATHTHSGPDILSNCGDHIALWRQMYLTGIAEAASDAMADRRPATCLAGHSNAHRLNFVRHYRLENGTFAGDNFGNFRSSPIADYASPADNQVQILRAVREGARDVLLINWQAHPKLSSTIVTQEGKRNRFLLSADYVAAFRDHIEAQTNAYAAFFLGASGDVNPLSKIPNHTRTTHYDAYGRLLAQTVLNALDRLKPIPSGPVNTQRIRFTADIDHTEDPLLEQARQIAALWTRTNDYALCVQTGRPHGIASPFHALSIIRRAQNPNTVQQMDIVAGSMGDVGFVAAPFEMFTANGLSIKARSPFSATFVLTCANGSYHYIASDQAFDYGSYEVHNRNYSRGTAEALANSMVDLLTRLHNTK